MFNSTDNLLINIIEKYIPDSNSKMRCQHHSSCFGQCEALCILQQKGHHSKCIPWVQYQELHNRIAHPCFWNCNYFFDAMMFVISPKQWSTFISPAITWLSTWKTTTLFRGFEWVFYEREHIPMLCFTYTARRLIFALTLHFLRSMVWCEQKLCNIQWVKFGNWKCD